MYKTKTREKKCFIFVCIEKNVLQPFKMYVDPFTQSFV